MTRTSAVAPPPPRSSLTDNYTKVRFGSFTYYDDPGSEVRFSSGPIQSKSFSHFHGGSFHSSPSHSFPSQQKPPKPPRPNASTSSSSSKVRRSSSSSTTMAAINSHSSSSPRVRPTPPTASSSFSPTLRRSTSSSPRGSSSFSPRTALFQHSSKTFSPSSPSPSPPSSSSSLLRGFTSPSRISPHSQLHRVHIAHRGGMAAFEAEIARGRVASKAGEDFRGRSCLLGKRPEKCAKPGEGGGGAPLTFNRLRLSEKGGVSAAPAGPPLGLDRLDCCMKLGDGVGWSPSPPGQEWMGKSAEEERAEGERSCSSSLEDHLRAQRVQFEMSPRQLLTSRHLSSPRETSGRTKVADIKVAEAAAFTFTTLPNAPIPDEKPQKAQPKAWVPSGPAKLMLGSLFAAVPKKLNDAVPASDVKDDTMSVLSLEFARARLRRRSGKTPVGIPKMGDVLATKDGKGSQLAGNSRMSSSLSSALRIAEQEPASSSASLGLKSPPSKISEKSRSQRSSEQQERKRKGSLVGKSATRRAVSSKPCSSSSAVSGWYLGRLREIARCFTR